MAVESGERCVGVANAFGVSVRMVVENVGVRWRAYVSSSNRRIFPTRYNYHYYCIVVVGLCLRTCLFNT